MFSLVGRNDDSMKLFELCIRDLEANGKPSGVLRFRGYNAGGFIQGTRDVEG